MRSSICASFLTGGGSVKPCLRVGSRGPVNRRLRVSALHGEDPQTPNDTYLAIGLAHCFEQQNNGSLSDKYVIEPITAASLECMAAGAQTSFKMVTGTTLGTALQRDRAVLPDGFQNGLFCADYELRCHASARTWRRQHAQDNLMDIVPLDQLKSNFNYKLEYKRVLNFDNIVSDDDNIRQNIVDASDKKTADEQQRSDAEEEVEDEEDEDDLESFLAA
eukprot:g1834.t1